MTCSQSQQQSSCDDSGNSVCSQCALLKPCAAAGLSSSYDASVDSNSEEGHEAENLSYILLVLISTAA